jgi:hypothetical protein
MMAQEFQLRQLAQLAWDLRVLQRSTMVVVTTYGEPVLYVPTRGGDKAKVMVRHENGRWVFTLGRTVRVEANDQAAGRIAAMVAA